MALFQILPAETKFFDWFEKGSGNLLHAARLLQDLVDHYEGTEAKIARITEAERVGDTIVHEVSDLLLKTLITPLDQEETNDLVHRIDDVVDLIEQAAVTMSLYKVEQPTPPARELAALIVASAEQIHAAMPLLRDKKRLGQVRVRIVEVHRLENDADAVFRRALDHLVATSRQDWFEFVRWKEIYTLLEDATDHCEDIADVLQTVVLKHG
jgi:uncharacterized protein